jgi:short-subunit dehydrogenase
MAEPVTLITGASAGIGAELARVFAAHGHRLMLVARREAPMEQLAADIAAAGSPRPIVLPIDLTASDAVAGIAAALVAHDVEPQYVVNNAGFGLLGAAAEVDRSSQLDMIDLNVRTLTDLSLAFVDSLSRHRGGILNVASVAAFLPGPRMAVYYASKAYVLSFSEALHHELGPRSVRVTALCPGPVDTEFQQRAGIKGGHSGPRLLTLPAARIAAEGYEGLMRGRRVVIPGWGNRLVARLVRLLPHGLVMAGAQMRQRRRASGTAPYA